MSVTNNGGQAVDSFQRGDYASAALFGDPARWQTHAARGLIGVEGDAVERLRSFPEPEARFYAAATQWIRGDDAGAVRELETIELPHARSLLALLRKPRIQVLAQCDRGSQWDFITAIRGDKRFEVVNVGFHPNDEPNRAYADIRRWVDGRGTPDFYIAKMLEWHLLPPNLQELECPLFGHTADYDLHIQAAQPWLGVFDELLTTDQTEWRDVAQLTPGPVSVFPKAFGLAITPPALADSRRGLDVFISGTTQHPYHPDKARLLHQVLRQRDLKVQFIEGFLGMEDYLKILGCTRAAFTYIRHPGGMPTRGLESLAMGAAVAVQRESVLRAYLGEEDGVVPYSPEAGDLPEVLRRISREWADFGPRARRGAERVRREFGAARAASQYFRFLAFLATKPRTARRRVDPATLRQKRSVVVKGWGWRPAINRAVRQQSTARWIRDLAEAASPEPLINIVREWLLEYATVAHPPTALQVAKSFNARLALDRGLLTGALELCRAGMRRFPDCLVLRFNAVRAACHFGTPAEVSEALGWAAETLSRPTGAWKTTPAEDVLPWDFFSQFFNYREYFDACTRAWQTGEDVSGDLTRLLLASMAHYASHYGGVQEQRHYTSLATRLDPEFPLYALRSARVLLEHPSPEGDARAVEHLIRLADESMLHLEACDLLARLQAEGRCSHPRCGEMLEKAELTRGRLHRTQLGTDDWATIPLRPALPASAGRPGPAAVPAPAGGARTRVLYLCLEFTQWHHARKLAYPAGIGMEEGFRAHGVDLFTLPSVCGLGVEAREAWQRQVRSLCAGREFDQVWVELVHSEWDEEFWQWIATLAPVRVGLVMESLRYEPEVYAQAPNLQQRQAHVERRLHHVTHALCIDEADAADLNRRQVVRAAWWPQAVPGRFILEPAPLPPDRRALFSGSVYGSRQDWLGQRNLASLLALQQNPGEEATRYPALFDEAHRAFELQLAAGGGIPAPALQAHIETWRRVRVACYELWLRGLQEGAAVVNLPSYVSSYAGRVFEGIAAGRPVLSWAIPDRPRTARLFDPANEILLFPKDDTSTLARLLGELAADEGLAASLTRQAQGRLRRAHTVERRIGQVLEWISTGVEPDYENPAGMPPVAPAPEHAQPMPGLNEAPQAGAAFWRVLGECRVSGGDATAGVECLAWAANLFPKDLSVHVTLGRSALTTGDWDRVRIGTSGAVRLDRRSLQTLLLCVEAGRVGGQRDLALRASDALESSLAEDLEAACGRARVLVQSDWNGDAVPDSAVVRGWLAPLVDQVVEAHSRRTQGALARETPVVAGLGSVDSVARAVEAERWCDAWNAAVEAIRLRPFHPEAWLWLARIAWGAGDAGRARACADRARAMAPGWKPARQFQQQITGKRPAGPAHSLPALPEGWLEAGTAPRLTVCVIARNEERFLARCLESVRGLADQLVVVDTGSTDRTVEIAREHGAEVHTFDWCDDFSAARNACLEHARGDWVLGLDADEELPASSHAALREALRVPGVMAWRLPLHDAGKEKEGCHYVPRLFRNAPGIAYAGRIHEHPFASVQRLLGEWGLDNRLGKAVIRHHGYADQVVKDRSKVQRNLRLLELAVQEQPDDPGLLMSYGLDLVRSGQLDAGLEEYAKAIKVIASQPPASVAPELRERLVTLFTTHLITAQRFQSVVELSATPVARATGPTASLHLMFGVACFVQKRHDEAAAHLEQCLAKRNTPGLSPCHADIHGGGPRHLLALCHSARGRGTEAEREFLGSLREDPEAPKVRLDFARFLDQSGRAVPALEQLHEIVARKPGEQLAWRVGAEIALREPGFKDFAVDWTGEAIRHFPRDPVLGCARAQALLLADRGAEAAPVWGRYHDGANLSHLAAMILCEALAGAAAPRPVPPKQEAVVSQEFCAWFRRLVAHGAESTLRQLGDRLPHLEPVLPSAVKALQSVYQAAAAA